MRARVSEVRPTASSVEKWPDYAYVTAIPFPVTANGKVARAAVTSSIVEPELIRLSDTG